MCVYVCVCVCMCVCECVCVYSYLYTLYHTTRKVGNMMIRNRALDRLRTFVTLIALTTSVLSLWLMYSVQQPQDTSPPWVSVAVSSEDTGRGRRDTGSDVIKDGGGRLKDALAGFEIGADVYNFNVSLSEGISLSRDIPDTRPAICKG